MPVGAGTTEMRICLSGRARRDRASRWRRLRELAERTGEALVEASTPRPFGRAAPGAGAGP